MRGRPGSLGEPPGPVKAGSGREPGAVDRGRAPPEAEMGQRAAYPVSHGALKPGPGRADDLSDNGSPFTAPLRRRHALALCAFLQHQE
jgi:hypothetical protein